MSSRTSRAPILREHVHALGCRLGPRLGTGLRAPPRRWLRVLGEHARLDEAGYGSAGDHECSAPCLHGRGCCDHDHVSQVATAQVAAAATPTFVQARANEVKSGTTNSLRLQQRHHRGQLDRHRRLLEQRRGRQRVADNRGNTYTSATAANDVGNDWSSQVFYATNIAGGATTVTATFGTADQRLGRHLHPRVLRAREGQSGRCHEVGDRDGGAMSSGSVTTTNADDLLFASGASSNRVTAAGSGYTTRSTAFGNRTQDRNVSATGSYAATGHQNGNAWVMQLVAFRADAGTGDTVAAERADRPHRHGRVHDADQLGVERHPPTTSA